MAGCHEITSTKENGEPKRFAVFFRRRGRKMLTESKTFVHLRRREGIEEQCNRCYSVDLTVSSRVS
jgi:hypothetical protein